MTIPRVGSSLVGRSPISRVGRSPGDHPEGGKVTGDSPGGGMQDQKVEGHNTHIICFHKTYINLYIFGKVRVYGLQLT